GRGSGMVNHAQRSAPTRWIDDLRSTAMCHGGCVLRAPTAGLDYFALVKQARKLRPDPTWRPLKMALLGDCSLQYLAPLIRVLLAREKVDAVLYQGEYDSVQTEAFDPNGGITPSNQLTAWHGWGSCRGESS